MEQKKARLTKIVVNDTSYPIKKVIIVKEGDKIHIVCKEINWCGDCGEPLRYSPQQAIDAIEDYVGGNFEDAKFDAMAFTKFLRDTIRRVELKAMEEERGKVLRVLEPLFKELDELPD